MMRLNKIEVFSLLFTLLLFATADWLFDNSSLNMFKEAIPWILSIILTWHLGKKARNKRTELVKSELKPPILVDILATSIPKILIVFLVFMGSCNTLTVPTLHSTYHEGTVGNWNLYSEVAGDQGALGSLGYSLIAQKPIILGILYKRKEVCFWLNKYGPGKFEVVDDSHVKCTSNDNKETIVTL